MFHFFRRIRKQLSKDSKPLLYAKYAIGEIVLVVLGILIALQINNWNEEQKTRRSETDVLRSLRSEFDQNLRKLEETKIQTDSISRNAVLLANIINQDKFMAETTKLPFLIRNCLMASPFIRLSNGVLNDVVYSGKLNIIQNDALRAKLSSFQSVKDSLKSQQEYINSINEKLSGYHLENVNLRKHFLLLNPSDHNVYGIEFSKKSINYDYLLNTPFENYLLMYHGGLVVYQRRTLTKLKEYLVSTRQMIVQELAY